MELPYDPFLYLKAVNEGSPIIAGAPNSAPAARFMALSATVFGSDGVVLPSLKGERKQGRFAFRRR
jgi:hypothetical protein